MKKLHSKTERDYLINHDIKISGDRELCASDELYYFRRATSSPSQKLIVFTRGDSEPSIAFSRIRTLFPNLKLQETAEDLLTKLTSYQSISEYYPLLKETAYGKAMGKFIAINLNCNIVYLTGKIIRFFKFKK